MASPEPDLGYPPRRGVILGASNVIRGIASVVPTAALALGGPLDLLAAIGHGRGYACTNRVLGRTLPAIESCGLWDALAARPPAEISCGLLTDIGNDLLFGASPAQIAGSVETCLQRMVPHCPHISIVELPLAALIGLERRRYLVCRTLLFPSSRLTFEAATAAAEELNQRLLALAERYGAVVQRPQRSWYGIDPIHVRRADQAAAWRQLLSGWRSPPCAALDAQPLVRGRWSLWLRLHLQRPQQRWLFGVSQRRAQPACRLADGTCISLY